MPQTQTAILADDRRSLTVRLSLLQYLIALAFAALAVGFWIFQIGQGEKFREMAVANHLQRLPLPAPRGGLFDRHGQILVQNRNTHSIALVRERTGDLEQTLQIVAFATGGDVAQLRETVTRRRRDPSYRPIVLIDNATQAQVIAVTARGWELPGIIPDQVPTRQYPTSVMAAHLFGYVGQVTEAQLSRPEYAKIESGAIIGQAGVEQAYNNLLMGAEGNKEVIVNSRGREIQFLRKQNPVEGQRLLEVGEVGVVVEARRCRSPHLPCEFRPPCRR